MTRMGDRALSGSQPSYRSGPPSIPGLVGSRIADAWQTEPRATQAIRSLADTDFKVAGRGSHALAIRDCRSASCCQARVGHARYDEEPPGPGPGVDRRSPSPTPPWPRRRMPRTPRRRCARSTRWRWPAWPRRSKSLSRAHDPQGLRRPGFETRAQAACHRLSCEETGENVGCHACKGCELCAACMFCQGCKSCYRCTHCTDSTGCSSCSHCKGCTECHACHRLHPQQAVVARARAISCYAPTCTDCAYSQRLRAGTAERGFHMLGQAYARTGVLREVRLLLPRARPVAPGSQKADRISLVGPAA